MEPCRITCVLSEFIQTAARTLQRSHTRAHVYILVAFSDQMLRQDTAAFLLNKAALPWKGQVSSRIPGRLWGGIGHSEAGWHTRGKKSFCLTLPVSPLTGAHAAAHTYSVPVGTCQWHTLATEPCPELHVGLWTSWLANTAGIKQIMKPDIRTPSHALLPAQPRPAPPHTRDALLRLSPSLVRSPSFFYSSLVLVLPVGRGEVPTSPQSPGRVPSPFMRKLHH